RAAGAESRKPKAESRKPKAGLLRQPRRRLAAHRIDGFRGLGLGVVADGDRVPRLLAPRVHRALAVLAASDDLVIERAVVLRRDLAGESADAARLVGLQGDLFVGAFLAAEE